MVCLELVVLAGWNCRMAVSDWNSACPRTTNDWDSEALGQRTLRQLVSFVHYTSDTRLFLCTAPLYIMGHQSGYKYLLPLSSGSFATCSKGPSYHTFGRPGGATRADKIR